VIVPGKKKKKEGIGLPERGEVKQKTHRDMDKRRDSVTRLGGAKGTGKTKGNYQDKPFEEKVKKTGKTVKNDTLNRDCPQWSFGE